MARHPEVKEKEIIDAALLLQQKGKLPNPGSIRAALGFRGGLVRIRDVWAKYQAKQVGGHVDSGNDNTLSLDDLPTELSDALSSLVSTQQQQLESIVIAGYQRSQALFEKRLDEHVSNHEREVDFYRDYETNADESITKLENELKELQAELKELADQNAELLIFNSKLSGQLIAFEKALPSVKQSKSSST